MRQFLVFSLSLFITACGEPAKLVVEDASVRMPAVPGNPGAAYFTVKGGPVSERLMSVTSPVVVRAEMHDSVMKDGMMTMMPINGGIDVPANGAITFAPRGKHVMLYDIEPKAASADQITLTFTFASGTKVEAQAKVMKAGDTGGHAH